MTGLEITGYIFAAFLFGFLIGGLLAVAGLEERET